MSTIKLANSSERTVCIFRLTAHVYIYLYYDQTKAKVELAVFIACCNMSGGGNNC